MVKAMRYENGKAIAGQVDAPFKVDWLEWVSMTENQKKGKKWLIENVPGAEGEINADLLTELWTNQSPSSEFAAQNVTLSSDDYDFLFIIVKIYNNVERYISAICPSGTSAVIHMGETSNNGSDTRNRMVTANGTTVNFAAAYFARSGVAQGVQNTTLIPCKIYGFKKTVKIKFDALAKDVSTLASKCMLEDGETSVEDALNRDVDFLGQSNGGQTSGTFAVSDISKYRFLIFYMKSANIYQAFNMVPYSLFKTATQVRLMYSSTEIYATYSSDTAVTITASSVTSNHRLAIYGIK